MPGADGELANYSIVIQPNSCRLSKLDNVNDDCVYPWNMIDENYLVYDICYDADGYADTNVVIVDYLPAEVDYYSSNPAGTYDANDHTVAWNIGTLGPNDSNCFTLSVKVTEAAESGGTITNNVDMSGDSRNKFSFLIKVNGPAFFSSSRAS